jgi:hypothetical protein
MAVNRASDKIAQAFFKRASNSTAADPFAMANSVSGHSNGAIGSCNRVISLRSKVSVLHPLSCLPLGIRIATVEITSGRRTDRGIARVDRPGAVATSRADGLRKQ